MLSLHQLEVIRERGLAEMRILTEAAAFTEAKTSNIAWAAGQSREVHMVQHDVWNTCSGSGTRLSKFVLKKPTHGKMQCIKIVMISTNFPPYRRPSLAL